MNAIASLSRRPAVPGRGVSALATLLATDFAFRGIGTARAAALDAAFGDGLHEALVTKDPRVVAQLGQALAGVLFEAYEDKAAEAAMLAWLEAHRLGETLDATTLIKIARCWGPEGAQALAANPCELAAFLPWATVEKVREALGVALDDPRRGAAAVEAFVYGRLDENHTWTSRAATEAGAAKLLNGVAVPKDPLGGRWAVRCAVAAGVIEPFEGGFQPIGAAAMEAFLAAELTRLGAAAPVVDLATPPTADRELDAALAVYDRTQPHPLTPAQAEAVRLVFRARFSVLAGYAGSGKTATLRGVCDLAERFGRRVCLMALSGRAAQRMAQATGREAMTIARFLKRAVAAAINVGPGTIVIVDEASMVDLPTLWRIVRRLGDATLVMVGDPAQLPPIGFGLTFHALVEQPSTPKTVLSRVLRQTADSGIPSVAESIRYGRPPVLGAFKGLAEGVSFVQAAPRDAVQTILDLGKHLVVDGMRRGDAQIISPIKGGPSGVAAINARFHALRRERRPAAPLFPGRADIVEGDPVIWTRNDHERDLMNGSMGRLLEVAGERVQALIDGVERVLGPSDGRFLDLAYAISVHKAQGSQWPLVIVPIFASRILDRTLIYTAATRAMKQIVFVGDRQAFSRAVRMDQFSQKRETTLLPRLNESQTTSNEKENSAEKRDRRLGD